MAKNLSILHVEDEFHEFLDITTFVKTAIEDFWIDSGEDEVIAHRKQIADSGKAPLDWVVYEIIATTRPKQLFRYIFVKSAEVPEEVFQYLFEERIFILDVLRPMEGTTQLGNCVEQSINSIKEYVKKENDVVLFTAHQGTGLTHDGNDLPRKISKETDGELEDFISDALMRCLKDG